MFTTSFRCVSISSLKNIRWKIILKASFSPLLPFKKFTSVVQNDEISCFFFFFFSLQEKRYNFRILSCLQINFPEKTKFNCGPTFYKLISSIFFFFFFFFFFYMDKNVFFYLKPGLKRAFHNNTKHP